MPAELAKKNSERRTVGVDPTSPLSFLESGFRVWGLRFGVSGLVAGGGLLRRCHLVNSFLGV